MEIIAFEEKYLDNFKLLNLEWLDKHGLTEDHDIEVLSNPREIIINQGGFIFLAKEGETIAGTAGLAKMHEGEYELIKMTVAPAFRGKGIGKMLIEQCLQKAKELNALKVILYSSSKLKEAIPLYEKYGFKHIPVIDSPFVTADVKMELPL